MTPSRSLLFAALAASGALAACGTTTRFAPLNSSPRPLTPRPAEAVEVLTTSLPASPYVEIGIIQGTQESELSLDEMPQILATMRVEAGRRGCDALVLNGPNNTSPGFTQLSVSSTARHGAILQGFWGTCVVYTTDEQLAGPVNIKGPGVLQPGERIGAGRLREPPPPPPEAEPAPEPPQPEVEPPPPPRLPPAPTEPSPPSN